MIPITASLQQMPVLAQCIADVLQAGDVVCLNGDLGAGKSTLAREIIYVLQGDRTISVPSPTFTLVQTYDTPIAPVWHMDWYRLNTPDEVYELGIEEAFHMAISLIEWAEKALCCIPETALHIDIKGCTNTRTITLHPTQPHHMPLQQNLLGGGS